MRCDRSSLRALATLVMPYLIHHFLENSADRFPEKTALVQGRRSETFQEVEGNANKIAHWLIEQGMTQGARVALLLRNSLEYVSAYYGILKSGCVAVPINTGLSVEELRQIVQDAGPRVLVTEKHFQKVVQELLDDPETSLQQGLLSDVNRGEEGYDWKIFEALAELYAGDVLERPEVGSIDIDLASIIYTSGSTGRPKGVMLSHCNVVSNTRSIVSYLDVSHEDHGMVILPFYYVYGKTLLNLHFFVGGSIVIDNRFTFPNAVLKTMIEQKVTGFAGVPSTYSILFNKSSIAKMSFPHLRYLTQAGGHMPMEIKEVLLEKFPDKKIFVMYGATEASARLSYLPPDMLRQKMGSIGHPIPNVEMKILKPDGSEASVGDEGEIAARGSNLMSGYWKNEAETKQALKNGWYHTGDLGRMDEDGYFYVTGRIKDMIKTGIHKVSPKEIEEVLSRHKHVFEVAVIAIPDETLGEAIKAYIVLKDETHLEPLEITEHCEQYLPAYKIPQEITFMRGLPKNESGKILKRKLAAAHEK